MADESNQTATEQWNITTLKAYLEQAIAALKTETGLKFDARDDARKLQADANEKHFADLNHEAARIQKATEVTVSRDTWDGFLKAYQEWKVATDIVVQAAVSRTEFQTYKDTLTTQIATKAAQTAVMTRIAVILAAVGSAAMIANVVWNMVKS